MNFDQLPTPAVESNQEKIKKGEVLEMLRANGTEHPETRDLVMKWTEQQEALVEKENTSHASIIFNIERADLYVAVGDMTGALECLEDARLQAHHENEKELYDQVMKKMDEIEGKNEKGQVSPTPEEMEQAEQWLSDHPVQVETKRGCEQEVVEFENMVANFEATYSLEELNAIVDLSADPERKHPLRDTAKEALKPIVAKLNALKNETDIDIEKYEGLKIKWKVLSNAVGMINNGIVDHNR